ncbi:MAG: aminotransferase class I/II-fold pyridoxal phosphate-dependent enzyme [Candidatus Eremiobacteraeota bacterium]|nr:aminotransferase class I/II-fold pyridoxal phosphate-dependent enzyme [Candidatus Eremiobacteraeota bacterium]
MAHSFASRVVAGARARAIVNAPTTLPIYQSAGWVFRSLDEVDAVYEGRAPGIVYGGSGVPNHQALEALICSLHGTQAAVVTTAGMSALTAILLHLGQSGMRVVAARDLYGNTSRLLTDMTKFGVVAETVEADDLDMVDAALKQPAGLLIVETISNPRVRVADLAALARIAHERGALLVVDNTLASPYHCRPAELGADLVMESMTKFLGGHHDLVLGCIAGPHAILDAMRMLASRAGLISAVLDSWLAARSIATLDVRLARSSQNALLVAQHLARHPKVAATHYSGLETDPSHDIARRTLSAGFGSVVSFELAPDRKAVDRLLAALKHVQLVLTFGGVATSLSHPATSSHRSLGPKERTALGIHDGFLRLSVGIEDASDVIADLDGGLDAV